MAVFNAHRHAALTDDFEAAYAGALNVQRVDALIYAISARWRRASARRWIHRLRAA